MEKKVLVILEILFIVGALLYYSIVVVLPDFKKNFGSSDSFIQTESYQNMFEFQIDQKVNFAIVLDHQNNVYHLFFLSLSAGCLYNQNLEQNSTLSFLEKAIPILQKNELLVDGSTIEITRYDDSYYDTFLKQLSSALESNSLSITFIEKKKTLKDKGKELGLSDSNDLLKRIDLYSKNILLGLQVEESTVESEEELDISTYADTVYRKLNDYIQQQQIVELDSNSVKYFIYLIPADEEGKLFPTKNSWYSVKEGKLYAYIQFVIKNHSYDFCYSGEIQNRKEGIC